MTATTDIAPFAGSIDGGFFMGLIAWHAIKKSNQNCGRNCWSIYCCPGLS
jgi:hypothetical protein